MKRLLLLFLAVFYSAAAFAGEFSISAGAGALAGGFFTRYNLSANGSITKVDASQEVNQFNYGFLAFLDATYAEFSVIYQRGLNNYKEAAEFSGSSGAPSSGRGENSFLGFSLLGKYPFHLNERLTIFPMLGVEYQISLNQNRTQPDGRLYDRTDGIRERDKDGHAFKQNDWDSIWINLGCGLDFELPRNFFIRGELLYGFRLMTPYEKKNIDYMKAESGDSDPTLTGLTSGPSIRISAGYKFFRRNKRK